MKLLIAGSNGQLGRELVLLGSEHELYAVDCDQLDITDIDAVQQAIVSFCPDALPVAHLRG